MYFDHAHALRSLSDPDDITYPVTQQDIVDTMKTHEKIYPNDARERATEHVRFRGVLCACCNATEAFDFSEVMNSYRASFIQIKDVDTSAAALKNGRNASNLRQGCTSKQRTG